MKYEVTEPKMFDEFYEDWSLTFLGVIEKEVPLYQNFINENGGLNDEDYYIASGKQMNDYYNLTGDNRYPDDLTILIIKQKSIGNIGKIAIPRFQIGGRWFTDVVDNNARRENEK